MRIVCKGNRGSDLPPEELRLSGNTPKSIFHITIGHSYPVFAMALWRSGLGVLTIDDRAKPAWKALSLFDVDDGHIPPGWAFGAFEGDDYAPVLALWGYPALLEDPAHHDDLIEKKMRALRTFLEQCDRSGLEAVELRRIGSLDELVANWNWGSPTPAGSGDA